MSDIAIIVEHLWRCAELLKQAESVADGGGLTQDELMTLQQSRENLEAIAHKYKVAVVTTDHDIPIEPPLKIRKP